MDKVDILAKKIWDYMLMHQELEKADVIIACGCNDLRIAERAAEIYLMGYAPLVVASGAIAPRTKFSRTEAVEFAEVMIKKGVPKENILLEEKAVNTQQNIELSRELLKKNNINVKSIIAVQKPFFERRLYATIRNFWPEVDVLVASPDISYEKFPGEAPYDKDRFINILVGDFVRIKEYPKLGFQIEQEIPDDVWAAGQELIKLGFNKHLPKS